MHNLSNAVRSVRVMNAVAAGTSSQNSSSIDMRQAADNGGTYEGVRFIAVFGALTATQVTSMKLQESDDNSNWSDITGATAGPLADGDSNKMLCIDLWRPRKRYVRAVVVRGTANAVIDGVIAELYAVNRAATAKDTTMAARTILAG